MTDSLFIQVEHTNTVYSHSLSIRAETIYRFWGFLTATPNLRKHGFLYNISFTKIELCSEYFGWAREGGGHGLKSFLFPI